MQRGWDDVAAGAELVPATEGGDGDGRARLQNKVEDEANGSK